MAVNHMISPSGEQCKCVSLMRCPRRGCLMKKYIPLILYIICSFAQLSVNSHTLVFEIKLLVSESEIYHSIAISYCVSSERIYVAR